MGIRIVLLRELLQTGNGGVQLVEARLDVLFDALAEQLLDGIAVLGEWIFF